MKIWYPKTWKSLFGSSSRKIWWRSRVYGWRQSDRPGCLSLCRCPDTAFRSNCPQRQRCYFRSTGFVESGPCSCQTESICNGWCEGCGWLPSESIGWKRTELWFEGVRRSDLIRHGQFIQMRETVAVRQRKMNSYYSRCLRLLSTKAKVKLFRTPDINSLLWRIKTIFAF